MPAPRPRDGPSPPKTNPGPSSAAVWTGAAFLVAAAFAAYGRTFSGPLAFDDIPAIVENPTIRHWRTAFWPPLNTTASGRPVLNLSLAFNYALSGTDVWSYHALNLLIHLLAGLTLFGIVRRTLVRPESLAASATGELPARSAAVAEAARLSSERAPLIAFCAALLWILHPLQTESVTYVIQRAESLMGLFYLLTLYCFIRAAETQGETKRWGVPLPDGISAASGSGTRQRFAGGWAALSVLFCLLGMATKEVMVSAPLLVLLYDRTFLSGGFREAWRRRRRIHAGLAATWLILPFLVISTHGRNGDSGFGSGISWGRYALTQFPAIWRYLKLSLWPNPLVFDYGTQWVTDVGSVLLPAAGVAVLVVATAWALLQSPPSRKRWRRLPRRSSRSASEDGRPLSFGGQTLGFAGAWFLAILAPTSLIQGNRQTAAEHRMYLALIPLVVLGVIVIFRRLGRGALPCCLFIAAAFLALTWRRNEDYRSVLDLWSDTVAKNPANPQAQNNLGNALAAIPGRSEEAIAHFQEAVRLKPGYAAAHNNLGNAWVRMPGRLNDAIAQYEETLRFNPDLAETRNNLGNALSTEGRAQEAIVQYEGALRLKPDYAEAHLDLAITLLNLPDRTAEAVAHLEAALRLQPGMQAAREILASLGEAPKH